MRAISWCSATAIAAVPTASRVELLDGPSLTTTVYLRGGEAPSSALAAAALAATATGAARRRRLGVAMLTLKRSRVAAAAVPPPPKKKMARSKKPLDDTTVRPGKIFVGGLKQTVDDAVLMDYFGKYGTITEAVVMMDRITQRSRGFGYVSFTNVVAVDEVLKRTDHAIHKKWVEIKRAVPRKR
jgi:hypothetical protein|tara:strand:- start:139 stop:690 length:552 start_codon:yes stop_codon:yes gene_type:complete